MKLLRKSSKNNTDTAGYIYTNTRVKALKAKLLKKDEFQKFLKMSAAEIARYLQETEYKKEINELSVRFGGTNLIEYALNKNMENVLSRILGFALRGAKSQIRLYLKRYDAANVKTILRGKFSKASDSRVKNELIAAGEFSQQFLENVIKKSNTTADVIEYFRHTNYYPVLKKYITDLTKLEDELDKFYYEDVLINAEKELEDYIRTEIFVKNTLNRLRAKKSNIKVEIIPGERKMKVPYSEDSVETRVYMKKLLIEKAIRMVHEVKRNIRPVLGYIITKENEVSNIRILTRGRHSGLKEDTIQKQLVI